MWRWTLCSQNYIRIDCEWTLKGDVNCETVWTSPRSVSSGSRLWLDELWKQKFKVDLPEYDQVEQQGLSREDCRFLELMRKSAELVDGSTQLAYLYGAGKYA